MDISIKTYLNNSIPKGAIGWMIDIVEKNMKTIYERDNFNWNRDEKIAELSETENYLMIDGAGFLGFRNELDGSETRNTTYIYEIQLEPEFTQNGLGTKLLEELFKLVKDNENLPNLLIVFYENFRNGLPEHSFGYFSTLHS